MLIILFFFQIRSNEHEISVKPDSVLCKDHYATAEMNIFNRAVLYE